MTSDPPEVSIILPTLNEAENLPLLIPRLHAAMAGRSYEVLVVDDGSTDGTPQVCAKLSGSYPLTLHVRREPQNGLSGAVLLGFSRARGDVLVVMDADLQHPPEQLLALIDPLLKGEAECVLGSRNVPGGSTGRGWGLLRRLNTSIATILARPFAGKTRDPMSGFIALRRETYERADRLTPVGYKIGLELMCKCRVRRVHEVPIHFDTRAHGESKLNVTQQLRYVEHLSRLYDFCYPRASPLLKFLAAAVGGRVALAAYLLLHRAGFAPFVAAPLVYPGCVLVAALLHRRSLRTRREFLATRWPWRDFTFVALAEWAACALASL